jgi:hypothetical protein
MWRCSSAAEVNGKRRFFEEDEAWPAGGSVSRQGRCSGCRPATGSGGGGAGRPRGAQGGANLLRRCSHAGETRMAGGGPAAPGGARLQRAAHSKERRGAWLGLRGKAAGVLRGVAGRGRAGHGRDGRRRADAGLWQSPVGARLLPGWAWRAWERVSGWVGGEMGRAWWAAA